jgi:hypothetical protein
MAWEGLARRRSRWNMSIATGTRIDLCCGRVPPMRTRCEQPIVTMTDRLPLPERTLQEQEKIVAAVLHWLATHEGWFLVVDNADELGTIWPVLPTGNTGHLLLTTRDHVVNGMEPFLVELMNEREGTVLFVRRAGVLQDGMDLE